jgi:iron complex outermembrane receptor protein
MRLVAKLLLAVAGALALAPAQAQEAAPTAPTAADAGDVEELIVTGTAATDRTALDSPVPVDLISGEDLARTGAVSDELGQALAIAAPSFNFPRQSNSGTSDHVRAGQLRGLSPDQLLVLVNGKRRHGSAVVNSETKIGRGTAAVDFNTIPLAAVERVEILRDGAGAQYGSDAVAGVINVLFDEDPDRTEIEVTLGEHITHHEPTDRDISDGETFTLNASTGFSLPNEGFLRVGFEVENRNKTNRAGFDDVPFFEPGGAYLRGRRNYTMGDPKTDAYGAWFNGELPVGEGSFYAFGTVSHRETRGGGAFYRYPGSSQDVPSLYPDGYRPRTRADDLDFSFTGGFEFELATWSIDTSLGYGRDELDFGVSNSANPSLGAASPTSFDSGSYEFGQLSLNADATREFSVGAFDGPLTVSAGIEYRRETYETKRGDLESYIPGPVLGNAIGAQAAPGLTPADEVDLDRDVVGLYVELAAEVLPDLLVDVAGRYEHYSDFGGEVTGKLSAAYTLGDVVTLRGAVSNSFRAPGIQQSGFSDTSTSFGSGSALVLTRTLRPDDLIAEALGAEELDAETSFNASVGVTAELGDFSASLDLFHVAIDDRITLSERFFDIDDPNTVPVETPFTDFVSTLPGGAGIESVRFFTNAIDTKTQGVDVVLGYGHEVAGGSLGLDAAFSYAKTEIEKYHDTPSQLQAIYSGYLLVGAEETNTIETAAPRTKLVMTADWENEHVALLLRASRYGKARRLFFFDPLFQPSQWYDSRWQLDLEGEWRISDTVSAALGAANVLDEYPERSIDDITYFGNFPYDVLSPVGFNGRYVYARLKLSF